MSTFTQAQARKASALVLQLMKAQRFFLNGDHCLDREVFSECIALDYALRAAYSQAKAEAIEKLQQSEIKLGIAPPVLERDQSTVCCSLYAGGLDIVRVEPIQAFLRFAPESFAALEVERFARLHGSVDAIAPRDLPALQASNGEWSERIWNDIQMLRQDEDGLVVCLRTRFRPEWGSGFKSFQEKVGSFTRHEQGLAELFYRRSCADRMISHDYVLFSCDRGHIVMSHWNNKVPEAPWVSMGGYECCVFFAFAV